MPIMVIRWTETGEYLKSFDPDVHAPGAPFPTGYAEWSSNLDEAMTFGHAGEAIAFYRTQSTVTPWRPDGRPNLPLTVFSVSFDRLADALNERDKANAPRDA
jgi:hypothetical protein